MLILRIKLSEMYILQLGLSGNCIGRHIRSLQINLWLLVLRSHVFHDSIYEDYAVICVNFREGNDCCVVLKSGMELYAFVDLPNTFHQPPRLLPRCHRAAGELLIHYESDCGYKGICNGGDFVKG